MKEKIIIANAGGFWGDDIHAMKRQLEGGKVDYITLDFLAEITMSILKKQQLKNNSLGYVADFVEQITDCAEIISETDVKIISNAGGINPLQCAKEIIKNLKTKGINLKIAIVEGDNIINDIEQLSDLTDFANMETGESFERIEDKVQSANVYLGVQPIVKALETGAQIIIAGRVTDTSITLAPMVKEFKWKLNDWDKLASGIIAGHIIECGAQSSGGNFTDWRKVGSWSNFGYPIVEVNKDSSFIVTKHPETGGQVSLDTVKEQILYEMGDPSAYISPDVIANFLSINLESVGQDRVKVSGINGMPSTKTYKVSLAYEDGYKASGSIIISGPDAIEKAKKFTEIFWERLNTIYEKTNTEFVGYNACHKDLTEFEKSNEVLLKLSVYDSDRNKIVHFSGSIAPMILSGPPGVAVTGGRPRVQSVMTYWPALVSKEYIKPVVSLLDENGDISERTELTEVTGNEQNFKAEDSEAKIQKYLYDNSSMKTVRLYEICLARSGDKGDTANIGVVARNEMIYQFLKTQLTSEYIKNMFADFCKGDVYRYELENLNSLNFLLEQSLDGGGTKSLMIDAQGKTFASALLNQKVDVPVDILSKIFNSK